MITAQVPTLREFIDYSTKILESANIDTARLDAEYLMAYTLGCKRHDLCKVQNLCLTTEDITSFETYIKRRKNREPVAYIMGSWEFYGLELELNYSTLIPRSETELLAEHILSVIKQISSSKNLDILDIGTGSGAIAIALAKEVTNSNVTAIDISPEALEIAEKNAKKHLLADNITFVCSNLFKSLPLGKTFDIIVSNPPYISTEEMETLAPEIRFEPRQALDGGISGLSIIKNILENAYLHMNQNAKLFLEIGSNQKEAIFELLSEARCWKRWSSIADYNNFDRIIEVQK